MSTSEPTTMPSPNHPDDEVLAALAESGHDAPTDADLLAHLSGCERCTEIVSDLRTLQSALAELPDITPSRPLRFLPPVPASPSPATGWAVLLRRLTAPAMAAAAVLILVGAIGTAANSGFLPSAASTGSREVDMRVAASAKASSGATGGQPAGSSSAAIAGPGATLQPADRAVVGSPPVFSGYEGGRSSPSEGTKDALAATGTSPSPPPFQLMLGAGVVLLAAAFLARAAARRRETS
jgi:hypothetical protein